MCVENVTFYAHITITKLVTLLYSVALVYNEKTVGGDVVWPRLRVEAPLETS